MNTVLVLRPSCKGLHMVELVEWKPINARQAAAAILRPGTTAEPILLQKATHGPGRPRSCTVCCSSSAPTACGCCCPRCWGSPWLQQLHSKCGNKQKEAGGYWHMNPRASEPSGVSCNRGRCNECVQLTHPVLRAACMRHSAGLCCSAWRRGCCWGLAARPHHSCIGSQQCRVSLRKSTVHALGQRGARSALLLLLLSCFGRGVHVATAVAGRPQKQQTHFCTDAWRPLLTHLFGDAAAGASAS